MTTERGKPDFLELVKSDRRALPKPPRLLAAIQQHLQNSCERLLEQLFAAADDVFYDLSKRAGNNSEENLYFESMREVRIAKPGLVRHFLQNININFNHLVENRNPPAQENLQSFSPQGLAIMDGEELEIDLALKGMVSRGRDMYRETLYELVMRLDHLLLQVEIQESNNPLDPHQIAYAFVEASSDTLNIDIKARLILFKLFEKHVLRQLADVYDNANQLLLDAGILPKIPRRLQPDVAKPASASETTANRSSGAATQATTDTRSGNSETSAAVGANPEPQTASDINFSMSLSALVSLVNGLSQRPATAPVFNCYITTAANPGPVMRSETLTNLLTRSQLVADRQLAKGPRNILPDIISMLLNKTDAAKPQRLEQNDEAVINLVSLFFNEVLADENLPLPVYALLCRLQIPMVKVALKERDLFSSAKHPARRLVNTITEAGIGFEDSGLLERDPVYRKIVDVVQTISREPSVSGETFAAQHQDLAATIQRESRKMALVEKRTSQSAVGRAKIRSAKTNSQHLLFSKLKSVALPPQVTDFLTTAWLQVLMITQLKHGCDSAEWAAVGHTADDLIWLCQRHDDIRSLQRRERLQPLVMERIEAELQAAIENPEVRRAKVEELQGALSEISSTPDQVVYQALTEDHRLALGEAATQDAPAPQAEPSEPVEPALLKLASGLEEGTWVECWDEDKDQKCRYKLATKVSPHTYVFVNRKGFKTLERSAEQLAKDLQKGRIRPLDSGVFFDRLMNKVLSQISEAA